MSNSVGVDVIITSLDTLREALSDLKLAREDLRELECQGQKTRVDFTIRTEQGERIGVRQNREGVEFVLQKDTQTAREALNRIRQSYARLKVLDEVKRMGYQQVKEEKLSDGSVRLVVQRWR